MVGARPLSAAVLFALANAPLAAQGQAPEAAAPTALVLRPEASLADFAERVATTLSRRTGRAVTVGEPPPPGIPEAVPEGQVALAPDSSAEPEGETRLHVVLGGASGRSFATELPLGRTTADTTVRSVALAIEALLDAASETPREAAPRTDEDPGWVTRWVLVRELPQSHDLEPIARPTIYLRFVAGWSPVREDAIVGPGAGLGLCVNAQCVVLEADVSLAASETVASDGAIIEYRPVNIAVRGQFRPDWDHPFTPGATVGFLTRVGVAAIQGTDSSQTVSNLGVRLGAELAWRFAPRFEWVLEGGLDIAVSRAQFVRFAEAVVLEDRWTPWLATTLRLRP